MGSRPRLCPTCGRLVYLNRDGLYRRHFAAEPDGRRHLCAKSGHESDEWRLVVGERPPCPFR
jgi:hypothetical protein